MMITFQCGFTLVFLVECVFKIGVLSWRGYIRRGIHKLELILALGSAVNVIRPVYQTHFFTYFQVFRVARLIKVIRRFRPGFDGFYKIS